MIYIYVYNPCNTHKTLLSNRVNVNYDILIRLINGSNLDLLKFDPQT